MSQMAELDGAFARITAMGAAKPGKPRKGKIVVTFEPKADHVLNGTGQPDLEIEGKAKDGVTFKTPVLKDKKGVAKKPRELVLDFEADAKLPAGEVGIELELRLVDVAGKDTTPRTVQLVVPVLLP